MKKTIINIMLLIMSLILLAGCAADEPETSYVYEYKPAQKTATRIAFEDIEYIRPDIDAMYGTLYALEDALQSRWNYEEICGLIDVFNSQYAAFDTMYTVASIRASMDVTDEYYDEERTWCMAADAEVQVLSDELYSACAYSEYGPWLEENVFWPGFCEEYAFADEELLGSYEEYFRILEREQELLGRYRDITAELSVELDGQERDFDEALLRDFDRAYAAYYEKYAPVLAELFIELVEVRQEYAAFMGFESYADYAYAYMFGRDYGPDEAEEYLDLIKKHMSQLFCELGERALAENLMYDSVDEEELELYLETLAEGFGGQVSEAYKLMKQYSMYDFSMSPNKVESSFVDYLSDCNIPFLFLCPYGYTDDVMTMCHEFGHYVDGYIREDAYESIDLAEVYSQAMQLLGIEQIRCVMTDKEHENFVRMNLLDIVSSMQLQSALAEFELRAYELEEASGEELNALYQDIAEEYGLCSGDTEFYPQGWIEIPHLFENPFYVISYSVSAPAALGLYEMELEKEGSGIECFVAMSESEIAGLREAMEFAGMADPLTEDRVQSTVAFLRDRL